MVLKGPLLLGRSFQLVIHCLSNSVALRFCGMNVTKTFEH
jgi:hypothetical protein